MSEGEGLVPVQKIDEIALRNAVTLWAETMTDASSDRYHDLRRDKTLAVLSFFNFVAKHPAEANPGDVKRWRDDLESGGLMHLHQTRHTFARIFSEDSGSMIETQDALDQEHLGTTRAYVQTIAVKKDKFSGSIRSRLEALDSTRS